MINKDYPNSEFIKVQRAAAQCAIDAYEQDEEWCPTKTTRLLEACNRIEALALLTKQPPASEFTKECRKHICISQMEGYVPYSVAKRLVYTICDCLDASESSRKELLATCKEAIKLLSDVIIPMGAKKQGTPIYDTIKKLEVAIKAK